MPEDTTWWGLTEGRGYSGNTHLIPRKITLMNNFFLFQTSPSLITGHFFQFLFDDTFKCSLSISGMVVFLDSQNSTHTPLTWNTKTPLPLGKHKTWNQYTSSSVLSTLSHYRVFELNTSKQSQQNVNESEQSWDKSCRTLNKSNSSFNILNVVSIGLTYVTYFQWILSSLRVLDESQWILKACEWVTEEFKWVVRTGARVGYEWVTDSHRYEGYSE